jgi:hypothetical protein
MINKNWSEAEQLIVDFLHQQPNPKTQDWKQLIELYPQHAKAIADAAIVRAAGDAANASVEPFELDKELANRTVSKALSKVHQSNSLNLIKAMNKVDSIKKPADRRQTAIAVGIGPHPSLLNGILSGRTKAPSRVLDALAAMFDVPRLALVEWFRRQFEVSVVPAFKSGGSKPTLSAEPASWEEAVKGLNLPEKETTRLLELGRLED